MKALLEHSVKTYGPLPSELRPRRTRSRKDSRPSPYPQSRPPKVTNSPDIPYSPHTTSELTQPLFTAPVVEQALMNKNLNLPLAPALPDSIKPSPLMFKGQMEVKNSSSNGSVRPRVGSNARRTAFGWSKRITGPKGSIESGAGGKLSAGTKTMSNNQKENVVGTGNVMT